MQDVKAKREARRRKILENSEKRLQKIAQMKYGSDEIIPDHLISASFVEAKNFPKNETNDDDVGISTSTSFKNMASSNSNDCNTNSALKISLDSSKSSPSVQSISNENTNKIWMKLGFKLVLLAIAVRIVHIFRLGYLFGETVVIPFSLFMMTQLGSFQFDQNIAGITGPVLLFFGVSPNKIRNLLICYNVVTSILIFFGIYFFTFILVHLICVIIFGL